MKPLTNITLAISIILFFSFSACINDNEIINEESTENAIIDESQIIFEDKKVEELKTTEIIVDTVIKETKIEKPTIKTQPKKNNKEEVLEAKKEISKAEREEEIRLSESIDLSTDRNQSYNPDNANAPIELEEDNSIELKPIFSAKDLEKYYVVFKESHAKISRKELSKLLKKNQIVYVVNHQGIYKYSVGKSENENDANIFKTTFDKEQGNTSSIVSTFSSAW